MFDLEGKRVYVSGHQGMLGSALIRRLKSEHCSDVLTIDREALDLRRQAETESWIAETKPDVVIVTAALVGGIQDNADRPANYIYDNLMIGMNLIHAAHKAGVMKLLFLGSSCIYPKFADQPISEDALLTGALEETNEAYAIAKIAGLKACQAYRRQHGDDFISCFPTSLYGPGDEFWSDRSHVIPALIRRFHQAKLEGAERVSVWGSGKPLREFMHVEDCADGLVYLLKHYSGETQINLGSGQEISIGELASVIRDVVGFEGELVFDASKPDGTPRKLLNSDRLQALGWSPSIDLKEGIQSTYNWFANHAD